MSDSLLAQAVAAHRANNLIEAERLYRAALAEGPERADAHYNLGLIYGEAGRPQDALQALQRATELKPDFGEAWFMLCEFADQLNRQELNLQAAEHAIRLLPGMARAWLRYGLALGRLDRDKDAVAAYRHAVELDPALIKAWVNLCVSSKRLGNYADAETAIANAIQLSGQNFGIDEDDERQYSYLHYHLALLELAGERYTQGFSHFRARFHGGTDWQRFDSVRPLWLHGEDLLGKTILITAEQGHGDTLMMARYLPILRQRGARVIFQLHPALMRYFEGWAGADRLIEVGKDPGRDFDYHAPVFELPYRFGTTLATVPARVPYLPNPVEDEKTDLGLAARADSRLSIGVVWAGQSAHQNDKRRSIPLEIFADLFDEDYRIFSLTRDMRPGEAELLPRYGVVDCASRMEDFADAARLMDQLDLIITCDTAAAHLAGGIGKPVWTLLPYAPDWRWGLERSESPWYPTMKLFRQPRAGDWAAALAAVKAELDIFAADAEFSTIRTAS